MSVLKLKNYLFGKDSGFIQLLWLKNGNHVVENNNQLGFTDLLVENIKIRESFGEHMEIASFSTFVGFPEMFVWICLSLPAWNY